MMQRCCNPRNPAYPKYGGAGITVCDRWRHDFKAFLEDMGPRPEETSLDRIDGKKNYEPGNCRWGTIAQQARNRSHCIQVEYKGRVWSLADLADAYGITHETLRHRIKRGWPIERALSAPLRPTDTAVTVRRGTRLLTFQGEERSISEWARIKKLHLRTLLTRIDTGWTIARALEEPVTLDVRPQQVGPYSSIREAAAAVGLKEATLRLRLRTGWDPEKALSTPLLPRKKKEK